MSKRSFPKPPKHYNCRNYIYALGGFAAAMDHVNTELNLRAIYGDRLPNTKVQWSDGPWSPKL